MFNEKVKKNLQVIHYYLHVKLLIIKFSNWLIYKHIVHTCAVTALLLARLNPIRIKNKIEKIVSYSFEMARQEMVGTLSIFQKLPISKLSKIFLFDGLHYMAHKFSISFFSLLMLNMKLSILSFMSMCAALVLQSRQG